MESDDFLLFDDVGLDDEPRLDDEDDDLRVPGAPLDDERLVDDLDDDDDPYLTATG